jgi:hypothetical protein
MNPMRLPRSEAYRGNPIYLQKTAGKFEKTYPPHILHRRTVDPGHAPQTLPVLQLELDALLKDNPPPPDNLDAKVEICFVIFWLWQVGQVTSATLLVLITSSSNGRPQSEQINSKMGMFYSEV